ncbi:MULTISPECIES: hypothetical protein [unclassified Rhizobium]|uniref:hypothetical protein n=1 Tax=unclassified Rhizobium TaxID=2613769 RepID=UPI003801EAF2
MSEQPSIPMGHGQMVDIVGKTADKWEIIFSEAGVTDYKAPLLNEIEADAIDVSGKIHSLAIAAGPSGSTVPTASASGMEPISIPAKRFRLARHRSKPLWIQ